MPPSGENSKRTNKNPPIRYPYVMSAILKARNLLRDAWALEFVDKKSPIQVEGDSFARFLRLAWECLPGELPIQALEDSLRHVLGQKITPALLNETAWRLAGNLKRLKAGLPVPPWQVQRFREWVPLEILSCTRERTPRGRHGVRLTFRVMAGYACPRILQSWWSTKLCRYRAGSLGFSKAFARNPRHQRYPFSVPEQFVGLRLYGLIDPEFCGHDPVFRVVAFPPSVGAHNAELLKRRFRVDPGYDCPKGFPQTFPCHLCSVGYIQCSAACHRRPWQRTCCPVCRRDDALFDRDVSSSRCIDCHNKGASA